MKLAEPSGYALNGAFWLQLTVTVCSFNRCDCSSSSSSVAAWLSETVMLFKIVAAGVIAPEVPAGKSRQLFSIIRDNLVNWQDQFTRLSTSEFANRSRFEKGDLRPGFRPRKIWPSEKERKSRSRKVRELILIKDILYYMQFNFLLTKKIILIKYRIYRVSTCQIFKLI